MTEERGQREKSDLDIFAISAYKIINDYFEITLYRPTKDRVIFVADPTLHKRGWKRIMMRRLASIGARAKIKREGDSYHIAVLPSGNSIGPPPLLNILLFVLTFLTVLVVRTSWETGAEFIDDPSLLFIGLPFTMTLMTILLVHEMGHFVAGNKRGVVMSYPFFIPAPTFIGTFGALIRSRTPVKTRNDIILIGASGPLAGFIPSIIALLWGYFNSEIVPLPSEPTLFFGGSLLTEALAYIIVGPVPDGYALQLSSIAFAGHVGLLITMLNLLPLGQLDGGHVIYGLLGRHQKRLAILFLILLFFLGYYWKGWWVWMGLAIIFRPFHPPVLNPEVVPDRTHKIIGWLAVALFILTFVPRPIY